MAGHGDSGASGKKSSEAANELHTFNAENMQSNMKIIYYSRTFLSIIGGVIAGILGFTGLTGFIFYFLIMAMASIGLITKAKFSVHLYFDSWNRILLDGFTGGLMSFVLFWTSFLISFFLFNPLFERKPSSFLEEAFQFAAFVSHYVYYLVASNVLIPEPYIDIVKGPVQVFTSLTGDVSVVSVNELDLMV